MSRSKFHVSTNLAISFDGKITTKDRVEMVPSKSDFKLMNLHRAKADAVIYGATTLRASEGRAVMVDSKLLPTSLRSKKKDFQPINVVLTTNPDFDLKWDFFKAPIERVFIAPRSVPEKSFRRFGSLAKILRYNETPDYPKQIIGFLKSLGCKNALLEGGGGIMFPWVENDLIDEWNVTISPKVIGGKDAPTMVEGEGFDASRIRSYRLMKCQRKGNDVFLVYRK
ncbi:MAG: dihydrofolate reductase family protein [Bdellovibrionota bacterium]